MTCKYRFLTEKTYPKEAMFERKSIALYDMHGAFITRTLVNF